MERVALKIQRRRYARGALREIEVHRRLRAATAACPEIIRMREAFLYDGHVCLAFDRHGRSLDGVLDRGAIATVRARSVTRQLLLALDCLHGCGYIHTDVKPGNILYAARGASARLADLGTARDKLVQGLVCGTRHYVAPEVIMGAPVSPALDLWSLGCSVFEILTGRVLFDPYEVAAKKYREFSYGKDRKELPVAASVKQDATEEKSEQLARGTIVAGKYRLERKLGTGQFSTVWMATQLTSASLDASDESLCEHARKVAAQAPAKTERQRRDREWQRAKGADDILDLALNYEHLLLIAALCGPIPPAMLRSAEYRKSYFESDGTFRFRPEVKPAGLRNRLRTVTGLKGRGLAAAADFMQLALTIDPAQRPSARAALAHEWIALA